MTTLFDSHKFRALSWCECVYFLGCVGQQSTDYAPVFNHGDFKIFYLCDSL
jgi:hypothetical protein